MNTILEQANALIEGDRQDDYGDVKEDWARTCVCYEMLTGKEMSIQDAMTFMVCVKLSRERNKHKADNIVDAIGYLALRGGMFDEEKDANG